MSDLQPGEIQWHSSEEDGGPDVGKLLQIDADNALWIGEITRKSWAEAGGEALGNDCGWWIIHYTKDSHEVIGKCLNVNHEQGDFLEIIAAAIRARTPTS